jgi:hypothetical protein
MDEAERSRLIDAWIEYFRMSTSSRRSLRLQAEQTHDWARDKMFDLPREQPELAWDLILEILARDPDDETLSLVAVGPLQDLVNQHPRTFADRIEEQARRNSKFREMLGGLIAIPDELLRQIRHLLPKRPRE